MKILLQDLIILMNGSERVSQTGKNQWINAIGQSTWSDGEPDV
jgi:hypothetical protein